MPLTESLTVRILGDSSDLQRELSRVTDEVDRLEERLQDAGQAGRSFGEALGGLSSALKPLTQISTQLDRIRLQLQALSRQPVTLNVQPALNSLQQLTRAAQLAAAQLRAISLGNAAAAAVPALPATPVPPSIRTFNFAAGGLVTGPTGVDRVPARLTAGEFVVRREVVDRLGTGWMQRLNMGLNPTALSVSRAPMADSPFTDSAERAAAIPDSGMATAASVSVATDPGEDSSPLQLPVIPDVTHRRSLSTQPMPRDFADTRRRTPATVSPAPHNMQQTTNQFGGIEIQVRETVDVSRLLQDLRHLGLSQRHRRG